MANAKRVLITGGVRRMGLHIAYHFAERGAALGLNYHSSSQKAAKTAREECLKRGAPEVVLLKGDITKNGAKVVKEFVKIFDGIDVLVNNAGYFPPETPLEDLTLKQLQSTLNLNLLAPFVLSKAAVPHMPKGSAIVNIASLGAFEIWKSRIDYHVSKAGLVTLTRALARELGLRKITVNAIAPGAIAADEEQAAIIGTNEKNIPLGKFGVPANIATAAVFLALDSEYITGQTLIVDGGRSVFR